MNHVDKTLLNKAFAKLRKTGIIARQNYLCCQSCGCAGVDRDFIRLSAENQASKTGFCFYHRQDSDSRDRGHNFHLTFGVFRESRGDPVAIGQKIVEVLVGCGIPAKWNGSSDTRICIVQE